jgi:hypothetical protein
MSDRNGKISISNFFESQFGYSVKLRPDDVAKLKERIEQIPEEGGYLYFNHVQEATRQARADEKGLALENVPCSYLEFAPGKANTNNAAPSKPAAKAVASSKSAPVKAAGKYKEF